MPEYCVTSAAIVISDVTTSAGSSQRIAKALMRLEKDDRLDALLGEAFRRAADTRRPVLVDCPIDYAENRALSQDPGALAPFLKGNPA